MIVTLLVVAVSNVDFADFYMVVIAICSCCSLFNSVCRTQRKANLRRSYTLDIWCHPLIAERCSCQQTSQLINCCTMLNQLLSFISALWLGGIVV